MNCSNCGAFNDSGEKFCKNCGFILNDNKTTFSGQSGSTQSEKQIYSSETSKQLNAQSHIDVGNGNLGQEFSNQNNNKGLNSNYVQNAVNPNMKKWAILSIVVPVVAMIWYIFIGLSFYLAVLIAAVGFSFSKKGEMANKKLANIGKVLNCMLCVMALIVLIFQLINVLQ